MLGRRQYDGGVMGRLGIPSCSKKMFNAVPVMLELLGNELTMTRARLSFGAQQTERSRRRIQALQQDIPGSLLQPLVAYAPVITA